MQQNGDNLEENVSTGRKCKRLMVELHTLIAPSVYASHTQAVYCKLLILTSGHLHNTRARGGGKLLNQDNYRDAH